MSKSTGIDSPVGGARRLAAQRLRARVATAFSANAMTDAVLAAYGEVLSADALSPKRQMDACSDYGLEERRW